MRLILGILGNLHHWANLHHCHQRPSPPGVWVFSNAGNARNPCKIKIVNFSIPLAFVSASLLEENWLRWQIVSIRWQNPYNYTSSEARCHVYHPSDPAVHAQLPTLEGPICLQSNEVIRFLWFLITSSRSPILHFDMVGWWKAIWKSINQVLSHILLPDSNHPLLTWHLWSENISMTKMRIKIAWAWDVENTAKFWPFSEQL